jgi:hypothetical protein
MRRAVEKRLFRRAATIFVSAAIGAIASTMCADVAAADQRGFSQTDNNCCGGTPLAGWRADILTTEITPTALNCVLYDVVGSNGTPETAQIEAGYARCGSSSALDSSCSTSNNRIMYVEIWDKGDPYTCYPHGGFSLSTSHRFRVSETVPGWFGGYVDGTLVAQQSGFNYFHPTDTIATIAWGELTGDNVCNQFVHEDVTWSNVQRYVYSTDSFQDVNSNDSFPDTYSGCQNRSSYSNQSFFITK